MSLRFRTVVAGLVNALILASCAADTPIRPIDPLDAGMSDASERDVGEDAAASDSGADTAIDAGNEEVCGNGFDDNGDGLIDEGCTCMTGATQFCYPGTPDEVTRGTCRGGTQTCTGEGEFGAWSACAGAVTPAADLCGDALDQDCNGVVDDGPSCCSEEGASEDCYEGPIGTRDVGACHAGTRTCASGVFGTCIGAVMPSSEICGDAVDNDCDGVVDNGCTSECPLGAGPRETCCGNVAGGTQARCDSALTRFVSLCREAGWTWVGDTRCSVGGSPSCESCLGGDGCCL